MPITLRSLTAAALAAGLGCAAPAVFAQAFDAVRLYGVAPGTDAGIVGAAVVAGTEYMGSDERRTLVLPVLDYQWRNGLFAGTTNGIGWDFAGRPDMQYGLRVTADFGRKESRSHALDGMGDVEARAEIGGFFNYFVSREVFLTSSLRWGAANSGKGLVVDLGAGYATALAPDWRLAVGAAVTLANSNTLQAYFGVSPEQAATSGYAVYAAGGGVRDVRANGSLTWVINRSFSLTTAVSASTLLGDAADSPLTRSSTTVSGVMVLGYSF